MNYSVIKNDRKEILMVNAALVLEGGSLRSLYIAGVLDVFIENKIEFSCVIGVSAGALTAVNYISKQKYRSAKINILHSSNPHYYGMYQLLTKKNAFKATPHKALANQ